MTEIPAIGPQLAAMRKQLVDARIARGLQPTDLLAGATTGMRVRLRDAVAAVEGLVDGDATLEQLVMYASRVGATITVTTTPPATTHATSPDAGTDTVPLATRTART